MNKGLPHLPDDEHRLVSLDPRDLEDLRRLIGKLNPETQSEDIGRSDAQARDEDGALVETAQKLLDLRRKRIAIFGPQMFAEPAWEMILTLYAEDRIRRHTQASLCEQSGASRSTCMRWIDFLVDQGLVNLEEHPTDKRRNFVSLSEKGGSLLELYLSETG